jgi:hypothetical protein
MTRKRTAIDDYIDRLDVNVVQEEIEATRKHLRALATELPRLPRLRRVIAFVERVKDENTTLYGERAQLRGELADAQERLAEVRRRYEAQRIALEDYHDRLDRATVELTAAAAPDSPLAPTVVLVSLLRAALEDLTVAASHVPPDNNLAVALHVARSTLAATPLPEGAPRTFVEVAAAIQPHVCEPCRAGHHADCAGSAERVCPCSVRPSEWEEPDGPRHSPLHP